MDFILNHPELALFGAWYVFSIVASALPLPSKESSVAYKITFQTVQAVSGALARAKAARKNGK